MLIFGGETTQTFSFNT